MWRQLPVVFAVLACGTSAMAQSTTCMDLGGGMIHCDTVGAERQGDGGAVLGKGLGDLIASIGEKSFRKKVGQMLSSGDCIGAARYALEKGRLELGLEIQRRCQPAADAPTGADRELENVLARVAAGAETPAPIEHGFSVIRVEALGRQLLLTAQASEPTVFNEEVRNTMLKQACSTPELLPLLRSGASVRTIFTQPSGEQIGAVLVTSQECGLS